MAITFKFPCIFFFSGVSRRGGGSLEVSVSCENTDMDGFGSQQDLPEGWIWGVREREGSNLSFVAHNYMRLINLEPKKKKCICFHLFLKFTLLLSDSDFPD